VDDFGAGHGFGDMPRLDNMEPTISRAVLINASSVGMILASKAAMTSIFVPTSTGNNDSPDLNGV